MEVSVKPSSEEVTVPRIKKIIITDEETEKQILLKRPEPEFKDKTAIIETDRVLLQNDQIFMCEEPNCNAVFGNAVTLNYHMLKHKSNRRIRCGICNTTFKSQEDKSKHLETFHPNLEKDPSADPLQCQKCKLVTSNAFALKRHIGRVHQTRKYPCPHCGYQFVRKECLTDHLKHKHPPEGQERPKYPCQICEKIYLYRPDLRDHIRRVHRPPDEGEQFKCNICNTIYVSKRTYQNHMRRHDPKYFCNTCNLFAPNKSKYYTHLATKSHKVAVGQVSPKSIKDTKKILRELKGMTKDELLKFCWTKVPKIILKRVDPEEIRVVERKTLQELQLMDKIELIEFCKRRVPKIILHKVDNTKNPWAIAKLQIENRLQLERKRAANFDARENSNLEKKESMDCVFCKKSYHDVHELKRHEKTCYKEKLIRKDKIVCPVCKKEFKRPHQLVAHSICHSKERSLKCQYCDATFKRKECRKMHEKHVHFGFAREVKVQNRILKSNHVGCGKQFSRVRSLKRHILGSHLGTRYPCTKCDKDFSRTDYLKNHYERMHAEELTLYKCKPCNKTFKHRRYFLTHSKKARQTQNEGRFGRKHGEIKEAVAEKGEDGKKNEDQILRRQ